MVVVDRHVVVADDKVDDCLAVVHHGLVVDQTHLDDHPDVAAARVHHGAVDVAAKVPHDGAEEDHHNEADLVEVYGP